jgi:acyl-coenzyme A thioesterase PaaI-like protein
MDVKTHPDIDRSISGEPVKLSEGEARVRLRTQEFMRTDGKGLVHGGFLFSAADYAAMLAVNEPKVVLARAEVSFLRPVRVGDTVLFEASVEKTEGKKVWVKVSGLRENEIVFEGVFLCVVPSKHVLD